MLEKEFEELVIEAISELPEYFRQKMENIAIHIEDFPEKGILKKMGLTSPCSLLGLYQGVPITRRGIHYRNVMPDRILIYRKPILNKLNKNSQRPDIKKEVKRVVLHEIGHYFGLSDEELYTIEKRSISKKDIRKNP